MVHTKTLYSQYTYTNGKLGDGLSEALAELDGLAELEGEALADGERDTESDTDSEADLDALDEGLTEAEGE